MFDGRDNGAVSLYHNGSEKLATTSTGISVTGNATFADNGKAIFGNSSDLQIYHDGSNSHIKDTATGNLNISGNDIQILNAASSEAMAYFAQDGDVTLYHNGAAKIATKSTGVDITGTLTSDGLTVDLPNTTDVNIDGTDGGGIQFKNSGAEQFRLDSASNDGALYHTPSGKNHTFKTDGASRLKIATGGDISFFEDTGTTPKFFWDSSAERLGIGTSSPLRSLHISGAGDTGLILQTTNANNDAEIWEIQSAADGSNNANLIFRSRTNAGTGGSERMRIDSSGNVGIGTATAGRRLTVKSNISATVANFESTSSVSGLVSFSDSNTTNDETVRAGAVGDNLVLQAGGSERMRIDSSGNLLVGKTSSSFSTVGARLSSTDNQFVTDGQLSAAFNRKTSDGDIIGFFKDGSSVGIIKTFNNTVQYGGAAAAIYLDTAAFLPANTGGRTDNTIDLGSGSYRYDDVFATNGTIQTSDRNEKQDIAELSDAEQRVAVAAKGLLRKFRWKDAVEAKGDEARTHFGIIAQDLQAAFAAEGLDAGDYAMFISSTWTDEETGEERTRMGVRYSELLAFIIAAI
jgi:hypothetical protein